MVREGWDMYSVGHRVQVSYCKCLFFFRFGVFASIFVTSRSALNHMCVLIILMISRYRNSDAYRSYEN